MVKIRVMKNIYGYYKNYKCRRRSKNFLQRGSTSNLTDGNLFDKHTFLTILRGVPVSKGGGGPKTFFGYFHIEKNLKIPRGNPRSKSTHEKIYRLNWRVAHVSIDWNSSTTGNKKIKFKSILRNID